MDFMYVNPWINYTSDVSLEQLLYLSLLPLTSTVILVSPNYDVGSFLSENSSINVSFHF